MTTAILPIDLEFPQRCRGEIRNGWRRRIYQSGDGPYRVVHHHRLMGRTAGRKRTTYSDYWSAEVFRPGMYFRTGRPYRPAGWEIISKHRKRGPAEAACRDHANSK